MEYSIDSYIQIFLFFGSYNFWTVRMNQKEKNIQNIQLYLLSDLYKETWFSPFLGENI